MAVVVVDPPAQAIHRQHLVSRIKRGRQRSRQDQEFRRRQSAPIELLAIALCATAQALVDPCCLLRRKAQDDQAQRQLRCLVHLRLHRNLVRLLIVWQGLQVRDQVESRAVSVRQGEGFPASAHEEVSLVATVREEAVQRLGGGEVAVANAHLTREGGAAQHGFRTMLVGQFQMEEAATAKIITAMDQPVAALAAGLADRRAVHHTQAAPGPTEGGAAGPFGQLLLQQRLEKRHRLVQPVLDRRIAQPRQPLHRRPGGRLVQRQTARAARHHQAQQRRAITHFTPALQRTAGECQCIQVKLRRQAVQNLLPRFRSHRKALHLCSDQNRSP